MFPDNTFKNYVIVIYLSASLSNHSVKNAVWLYFEHSLSFDVLCFSSFFSLCTLLRIKVDSLNM